MLIMISWIAWNLLLGDAFWSGTRVHAITCLLVIKLKLRMIIEGNAWADGRISKIHNIDLLRAIADMNLVSIVLVVFKSGMWRLERIGS
jgi:hypothetical protein